ncbi:high-affinity nickel-transport family protein [Sorangium sp. So ce1000]|uniref:HoxN/HupN/NixA family nickel/cobalt transporter n=1 Tax=Sorangium sp. So ce1000 TaxID=3133325 RepID=UPI003F62C550
MTGVSALLLGLGLGLRHAADADHLVVVATLLQRERGPRRAALIAALWGLGHSATFLGVGLLVVLLGLRIPAPFERAAELLVAFMLIGLGAWHLVRPQRRAPASGHGAAHARSIAVGLVHGLAGSAGIALLATTTIPSRLWAAAYLALFGLGTVTGMIALTVILSWPIGWTLARGGAARRFSVVAAALLGIATGVVVGADALLGAGAQ